MLVDEAVVRSIDCRVPELRADVDCPQECASLVCRLTQMEGEACVDICSVMYAIVWSLEKLQMLLGFKRLGVEPIQGRPKRIAEAGPG